MTNDFGQFKIIKGGKESGQFQIRDGLIIGRAKNCDVIIEDSFVSRQHCKINIKENKIEISDLDSRVGTKVNGKLITAMVLKNKDRIEIGDTVLIYEGFAVKKVIPKKSIIVLAGLLPIILLVVLFILPRRQSKSEEISLHASAGKEYYLQGRIEEALVEYEYCLKLDPQNETIMNNIAKINRKKEVRGQLERIRTHIEQEEFDIAHEKLEIILSDDPENKEALSLEKEFVRCRIIAAKIDSVNLLIAKNKFDEAMSILSMFYEQYHDSVVKGALISTLLDKGRYLAGNDKRKEAIEVFNEVLAFDSLNSQASAHIERLMTPAVVKQSPSKPPQKLPSEEKQPEIQKTPSPPPEKEQKPSALVTQEQKEQAKKLYWDAYRAWKDDDDVIRAKQLFRKVLEVAPDPDFEFYQKAKAKLKDLK